MPSASTDILTQLYNRPGFLLRRAHQISVAIFEDSCAALGLSPAQYAILAALHDLPGVSQGDIARALGMNKVTVSQVVRALEERGWVARTTGEGDRRCLHLVLTRAGKQILQRATAPVQQAYDKLMAPFDGAERELLGTLLQRIVTDLAPHARAEFTPAA